MPVGMKWLLWISAAIVIVAFFLDGGTSGRFIYEAGAGALAIAAAFALLLVLSRHRT